MKSSILKQGFHFASDGVHAAQYIEAATIREAEEIYQKAKQLLNPPAELEEPADLPADNTQS